MFVFYFQLVSRQSAQATTLRWQLWQIQILWLAICHKSFVVIIFAFVRIRCVIRLELCQVNRAFELRKCLKLRYFSTDWYEFFFLIKATHTHTLINVSKAAGRFNYFTTLIDTFTSPLFLFLTLYCSNWLNVCSAWKSVSIFHPRKNSRNVKRNQMYLFLKRFRIFFFFVFQMKAN